MKSTRSKSAIRVLFLIAVVVVGFSISAYAASPSDIVGTWGWTQLEHKDDGSWSSSAGTLIFNNDGTGTNIYKTNSGGIPKDRVTNFTYSTNKNKDGSITLTRVKVQPSETEKIRLVLSDNRNMFITDGTSYITDGTVNTSDQMILATKMDTTKTCANADLKGEYYFIGYEYNASGGTLGYRRAWSGILKAEGNTDENGYGNYSKISTLNGDGTVKNLTQSGTYKVNENCSIVWKGGIAGKGYLNGDGKLAVTANPASANDFVNYFLMKKGDKTYSISDVPGTFAYVAFGDEENGNSFNAEFGTCTNNGSAESTFSGKFQADGSIAYFISGGHIMSGKTDGSINFTVPYAGAAGNNGNAFIQNARSFRPDEITDREIMIGVRCSDCINVEERKIPMLVANCTESQGGVYLYDPGTGALDQVNQNCEDLDYFPSLNSDQTKMVYATEIDHDHGCVYIYDIASKTNKCIANLTRPPDYLHNWGDLAAYFDKDDKIIFNSNGTLRKMNADGSNKTTIITPPLPYRFSMFWMSPNREKIIVNEFRSACQDYETCNYERLVEIKTDGSGRRIRIPEYLGQWNNLSWKQDSCDFLYYHHVFSVVGGIYQGETPKYLVSNCDGSVTDLSDSPMGKDENICFYTKSDNLLSLSYRELYDGKTGDLISNVSSVVPELSNSMFGLDFTGEIYSANYPAATNLRRFVELPTQLTAKAISSSKIVLGWVDNAYNAGFKIERKLGNCSSSASWSPPIKVIKPSNITTYTDIGLNPNTTYSYRVRAYNSGGNSVYSNCVSAKTGFSGTPNSPTNLKATSISTSQIKLTWTDNSTDETSFKIYRKAGAGSWGLLATKGANIVSHTDNDAPGNTTSITYNYYIQACNGSGCSPSTNTATVPYSPTALLTNAIADMFSFDKINLTWHDNSNNETGFEIDRKSGTCAPTIPLLTTTPPNIEAYTDMGVSSATTYSYKVRAYKRSFARPYANGYSLFSNCSQVTTP